MDRKVPLVEVEPVEGAFPGDKLRDLQAVNPGHLKVDSETIALTDSFSATIKLVSRMLVDPRLDSLTDVSCERWHAEPVGKLHGLKARNDRVEYVGSKALHFAYCVHALRHVGWRDALRIEVLPRLAALDEIA